MLTFVPGSLLVLDAAFAPVARSIGEAFGCKVVVLGSQVDGITQISLALADGPRPTALHIVAHGSEGNVRLGPTVLDAGTLTERADEIAGWGRTLGSEGSILLYGCDVAGGADGAAFVTQLAAVSGVAVAASTNATGPLAAGGDWVLETATGPVAPALPLDQIGTLLATGNFIVGDGSGGGGGSSVSYAAPGGHGGGGDDTLVGGSGNDVIIGDGSGGGGAGKYSGATAAGGQAGGGNDSIAGGAGNDILIGDGFNGEAGGLDGGRGGYGGGGGGAAGASYSSGVHTPGRGGDGGLGAGGGGGGWSEGGTGNNGGNGGIGAGGGGGGGSNAGSGTDGTLSGSAAGGQGGTDAGSALSGSGGGGYFGAAGGRYSYGDKPSNGGDGTNAVVGQGNGGTAWGAHDSHTPIIAAAGGGGFGNGNGGSGGHYGNATAGGTGDTATYTMPDTAGAVWAKVDADLASGTLAGIISSLGTGGGADTLNGGQGSDQLLGLGGADLFVIDSADAGVDDTETIWDFNLAEGDQIELRQQGVQLDHAALTTLLGTQTTVGADRQVVFSDGAGHSQTVVVKGIGRDLTAGDFRNRPAFAGDLNGDGVYDQAVTVQEDGSLSLNALLGVTNDVFGQTLTWTLAAGPSAGTGAVTVTDATATSAAGQVTPSGTFLYTPPANATPSSQFTVQVDDGQGGTDSMVVNVQVLDRAPVLAGATQGVAENVATGVTLHTVDTSAGDQTGLTNWQILTGNDDGVFTISSGGAISLAPGKSLDYESSSKSYTLGVQVQDEGGTTAQAQITLNVTNVNEAPGTISLTQTPVTDASSAGATVGSLNAVDPEGDQVTYAITSGGDDFALDGSTLTLVRPLTAGNHSVTVRAQDPAGLSSINTFTVPVSDGTPPVVTITGDGSAPRPGDTVAITFTLSEAATDFTAGDVTVTGGTLSGFTGTATAYTANFTAGAEGPSTIRVDAGTFNDAAGNANATAGELALNVTAAVLDITGVGTELREGDADTTAFTFTVQRSGNSRGAVTADWAVSGTAVAGDDFDGGVLPTGTVTFADGETTATITVQVAGDTRIETDEAFTVALSNPVGARIASASVDALILNDDVAQGGGSSGGTTTTVDGATVTRTTTTTSDGRIQEVMTIAPIATGRTDLADVPLAEDDGASTPALMVSLPAGVGLRAEGSPTRLFRQDALGDLTARIEEKTGSATDPQKEMTDIGQSFLTAIPENSQLYVKTVTPSLAAGLQHNGPITITGAGASLTGDQQEALVIDVSSLPSGTVLQLEDVDFAAIVGEAQVIGGAGRNVVTGDDSPQVIVLGPGDDILHGGGGDDTIGSEGGRDILHGGAGNDTVFGGADHDFIVGGTGDDTLRGDSGMDALRFDVGYATAVITRNAADRTLTVVSTDGTDSISTAEILVFSDRVDLALAPVLAAAGFDEGAYLSANPDVAAAVTAGSLTSGHQHFRQFGDDENRAPNPLFDPVWYLAQNPDVAAAVGAGTVTAWQHYSTWGWTEGRDSGPLFDQSRYLEENPDVAAAGMDTLTHYLHWGWSEGRAAHLADNTVFG